MSAQVETRDLVITRVFDAPVEQVWKAWTDSEQVMRWWGPKYFTSPMVRIDFREGGTSLLCMRAPQDFGGQDFYNTWTYSKIVPLQQIEFVNHFTDENGTRVAPTSLGLPPDTPEEMRHVITFNRLDGNRTEVTVTEYGWPVGQMMEMSRMGMEQCLDKMADILK